jgi:hypothetical protein
MAQITLTLDLTRETVDALHALVDTLNKKTGKAAPDAEQMSFDDLLAKPPKKKADAKPAEDKGDGNPADAPIHLPAISLTDVRAVALKLSKAGQQAKLKEIFAKYDAKKLSDISEENYPALMADLEAVNG